ncbi:MAG: recombinase family protein [Deltaproteobacteria bacterium]|nr:recombinase family protein [Deltaproteobacteria bacterium]
MVVDSILRKRSLGWSYKTISEWLTLRGIKSPSRQTRWYHTTIRRIETSALESTKLTEDLRFDESPSECLYK